MTQGTYRPPYRSTYKAGLDENNNLIAFSVNGVGLPEGPVFPKRFPAGAVENYVAEKRMSETNISTGAWRAPRSHFTAGAEQSFLDEVAELAGKEDEMGGSFTTRAYGLNVYLNVLNRLTIPMETTFHF